MPPSNTTWAIQDLADLLARTIGQERAEEVVVQAVRDLGLPTVLDAHQSLQVLEKLSEQGGLIGITAVFAKSRIHLADPV